MHDSVDDFEKLIKQIWISIPPSPNIFLDLPIVEDDQSPGGSYENLRKIIHAVIQEVIRLPEFYNQKDVGVIAAVDKDKRPYPPFEPKNYEDLLATAVINKVIWGIWFDFLATATATLGSCPKQICTSILLIATEHDLVCNFYQFSPSTIRGVIKRCNLRNSKIMVYITVYLLFEKKNADLISMESW